MQPLIDLKIQFKTDVESIAQTLVDAFDLRYTQTEVGLESPVSRWLDFRLRYIDPVPRTVCYAVDFEKIALPTDVRNAVKELSDRIEAGADINPFQSKGLILHNDTSGDKRHLRTDLLWADWGIHHLHLDFSPIPNGSYFSSRSNWLIFLIVVGDTIGFVDVKEHSAKDIFVDDSLLTKIIDTWPEYMERFQLDVLPSLTPFSPSDRGKLRKSGMSAFFEMNGSTYLGPGLGLTSASTSTLVSLKRNRIHRIASSLAASAFKAEGYFSKYADLNTKFSLAICIRGLGIFEELSKTMNLLPKLMIGAAPNDLTEFTNLLCPSWAIDHLVNLNHFPPDSTNTV